MLPMLTHSPGIRAKCITLTSKKGYDPHQESKCLHNMHEKLACGGKLLACCHGAIDVTEHVYNFDRVWI